ncbi:MAG: thioredoxin family protein [Acidobacteria bacterium]|nr:thioredoxin family protein [Acidobacteriota bacterium]MCW5947872.1 thioredoxin family protein [Pyrinomonadaceae bacterium]
MNRPHLTIAALLFSFSLPAVLDGQVRRPARPQPKKAAAKKSVSNKPPSAPRYSQGFVRERFDPRRDPNADLAAAIRKAAAERKRIILDVGGEWCGWCVHMDKFFYQRPELDRIRLNNFVWVKVNMSPENENRAFLSKYPPIDGYPHLFVLESDGTLLLSQGTDEFEIGDTYDPAAFEAFFAKWAPPGR